MAEHFHEAPLAAFTTLAITGGGLAAGRLAMPVLGMSGNPARTAIGTAALLIGFGLVVSMLHLGRRGRMLLAFRRVGRSALSTEVVLAALTTASASAYLALPVAQQRLASWIGDTAALSGFALLCSIAWVYSLPGQLFWDVWATPGPVVLGMVFGILPGMEANGPALAKIAVAALLAGEAALYVLRWRRLGQRHGHAAPAHPDAFQRRRPMLALRLLLTPVLPVSAIIWGTLGTAAILLAVGIAFDRLAFYALALRQTTESEIARIERVIREEGESPLSPNS